MTPLAVKNRIYTLFQQALEVIESDNVSSRSEKLSNIAKNFDLIRRDIKSSQHSVNYFHRAKLEVAGGSGSHSMAQSRKSRLKPLSDLELILEDAWAEVIDALIKQVAKSPVDHTGKSVTRLLNELGNELSSYQKQLKSVEDFVNKLHQHTSTVVEIRQDFIRLPKQSGYSTDAVLGLVVLILRISAMLFRSNESPIRF